MRNARTPHVCTGLIAVALFAGAPGLWVSGCAEAELSYAEDPGGRGGNGGALSSGGSSTGGRSSSSGGRATGGTPSTGGSTTGGVSPTGGRAPTGGAPATGGRPTATGGATGGLSPTGGAPATGGTVSSTGGAEPTGGVPATGGSAPTGGAPSTGGPPDNVLMSYGFEQSDPDGWRARGTATLTITDEQSHSGESSLKVTGRTANWHGAEYDVRSLVTAGDAYAVSVWARPASGSPSSTLRLTREVQGCSVEQFVWLDSAENATSSAWVELSGTLSIPASCAPSKLLVYVESTDATASYYVDDTSMSPL